MRMRTAGFLLLLIVGAAALQAQSPSPGSASATRAEESVEISETTTTTSVQPIVVPPPGWVHLVRLAAMAGPIAFLLLAWIIGLFLHYRLVRGEQAKFPAIRGSRTPQTLPMVISAALFFVPAVLFVVFEVRSRIEIRRGIGGVVDEWHPVTAHAWTALVVCLVLALVPWLFARRADTVG